MNRSRICVFGRDKRYTSLKIPLSHHISWSSTYVESDHLYTRAATVFLPERKYGVILNSAAIRLPWLKPTSCPLIHKWKQLSTPSNVMYVCPSNQCSGT